MSKTEITLLSDLHMSFPSDLPGGDILVISGDITYRGRQDELEKFNQWIEQQDYAYRVLVAGNHDFMFEQDPERARLLIPGVTHYLNDSGTNACGLNLWGSPITPWFHDWAFNRYAHEITNHWKLIPEKTDILITHGPPYGILDKVARGPNVGCPHLLEKVKLIKPKIHVFGHIHEGYGEHTEDGIRFINASRMDLRYNPVNKPIHIKL